MKLSWPKLEVKLLERVEMVAANGEAFPQNLAMGEWAPGFKSEQEKLVLVKRRWLVERNVRDDSRSGMHVREVGKAERTGAQTWIARNYPLGCSDRHRGPCFQANMASALA